MDEPLLMAYQTIEGEASWYDDEKIFALVRSLPAFRRSLASKICFFVFSTVQRADEVKAYLVLVSSPDVDLQMSFSALSDGNAIDACFGKSSAAAKPAKQRLRGIRDMEQKEKYVKAYAELFRALEQHHEQLASSCCGGACSEGQLKQDTKNIVADAFRRHGIS